MFSSWDERRFMGAVLCVITKSVSYRPHQLFVLRTLCQRRFIVHSVVAGNVTL